MTTRVINEIGSTKAGFYDNIIVVKPPYVDPYKAMAMAEHCLGCFYKGVSTVSGNLYRKNFNGYKMVVEKGNEVIRIEKI